MFRLKNNHRLTPVPKRFSKDGIVFIHIPKCAGSSFLNAYLGYQLGHTSAAEYYAMDPKFYQEAFVFTICRNPIERFISAYFFIKQDDFWPILSDARQVLNKFGDTPDDLALNLTENPELLSLPWLKPQSSYIEVNGFPMIDKVFKIEDIGNDLSLISDFIGVKLSSIPSINENQKRDKKFNLSTEAKKSLENVYFKDFTLLGYY